MFHAFDDAGVTVAKEAYNRYRHLRATAETPVDLLPAVNRAGFQWGESDGT
ncbi:MAG: hypothetical protein WD492_05940 [Alkalispirochaeta sp.]